MIQTCEVIIITQICSRQFSHSKWLNVKEPINITFLLSNRQLSNTATPRPIEVTNMDAVASLSLNFISLEY